MTGLSRRGRVEAAALETVDKEGRARPDWGDGLAELRSDNERVIEGGEEKGERAAPDEERECCGGALRSERELEGECPRSTAPSGGLLGGLGLEE